LTIGALGGLAGFYHLGRPFDPRDEATIKKAGIDETQLSPWAAYWQRAKFRVGDYQSYFSKPAWDYLLPEPLPEQYQRPYTLLINLDETLVYSSWDIDHGWRTAKRPGVDYFLGYMSKFYEIVLFTTQPSYVAMPIIEKLDPYGYIMYHLYRESTRYDDGTYIKDISKLNRDLSKVIAVDSNPAAYSAQPSNLLSLKPWKGDPDDTGLIALIPFLEYLAMNDVADVRKVLDFYRGKDVATEFNNWEKHLKEELRLRWLEDKEKKAQGLSGWLGMGSGQADEDEPPKPFFEQNRIALRKAFEDEQATIKEHAEAERKRMMEEQAQQLKDMKLTMWKIIKEGGVPQ
ncbi:HAD-like domain-containing protein, partial [Dimargaris cristalligena]